ncbi:MAG: DNA polymerase III subunit beta [Firmicutes bacterium]|nr:DNA polymerase III subunit beta [Bacillota bacterium]
MRFSCMKNVLQNNINLVSKAVAGKTTMPILECILLTADDNGLRLTASDMELGIETKNIEADIIEMGKIAVEAKIFGEIIRNLPDGELTFSCDEKNVVVINCGKAEFKILGKNGNEFPLLAEISKNFCYEINSQVFKNMIKQTLFSVSTDENKIVFTGELMDIKNNKLNLVSVDGFRVSLREYRFENDVPDIKAIVIAKALSEIERIAPDDENENIKIYFSEKEVLFELENCIMIARLLEGNFVKYESLFNDNYTTKININRQSFLRAMERASLISQKSKNSPIKINIKPSDEIEISSSTEYGESFENVECDIEGSELVIGFNPKYLIEAMRAIDDEDISIQFLTAISPCIIKSDNEDCNYKYLIIPLKLN